MSCEYCVIHVQHYSRALECDVHHNFCWNCGEPLTEPKPLTLEQLREMDFNDCKTDTAVWIREIYGEILGQSNFAYRALLDKVHNKIIVISGEGIGRLRDDNYGKAWLAYTHKPKEAQR